MRDDLVIEMVNHTYASGETSELAQRVLAERLREALKNSCGGTANVIVDMPVKPLAATNESFPSITPISIREHLVIQIFIVLDNIEDTPIGTLEDTAQMAVSDSEDLQHVSLLETQAEHIANKITNMPDPDNLQGENDPWQQDAGLEAEQFANDNAANGVSPQEPEQQQQPHGNSSTYPGQGCTLNLNLKIKRHHETCSPRLFVTEDADNWRTSSMLVHLHYYDRTNQKTYSTTTFYIQELSTTPAKGQKDMRVEAKSVPVMKDVSYAKGNLPAGSSLMQNSFRTDDVDEIILDSTE